MLKPKSDRSLRNVVAAAQWFVSLSRHVTEMQGICVQIRNFQFYEDIRVSADAATVDVLSVQLAATHEGNKVSDTRQTQDVSL